jgi:hypothetical protein
MHKYDSVPKVELYQQHPIFHKPSLFKARSWTETIEGYTNNAHELTCCILSNLKLRGIRKTTSVSINITKDLSVDEIKLLWSDVSRKMRRRGVQAIWVREPNERNRCNYHLLVISPNDPKAMRAILEASMPSRKDVRWHSQVEKTDTIYGWSHYITKAVMPGKDQRDRIQKDLYGPKRLLFKTGTGLDKHGTIGKFWHRPKAMLWKEIKDIEARIAQGLQKPGVKRVADLISDWFQGDHNITSKEISRRIGYWADEAVIKDWAERLEVEAIGKGDGEGSEGMHTLCPCKP